jgi:hypothetical protein
VSVKFNKLNTKQKAQILCFIEMERMRADNSAHDLFELLWVGWRGYQCPNPASVHVLTGWMASTESQWQDILSVPGGRRALKKACAEFFPAGLEE